MGVQGNSAGAIEMLSGALAMCQKPEVQVPKSPVVLSAGMVVQRKEQLLVREAEIHDKLAQIYLANGEDALARKEVLAPSSKPETLDPRP
eukprot:178326-Rhodomonas_salina.1